MDIPSEDDDLLRNLGHGTSGMSQPAFDETPATPKRQEVFTGFTWAELMEKNSEKEDADMVASNAGLGEEDKDKEVVVGNRGEVVCGNWTEKAGKSTEKVGKDIPTAIGRSTEKDVDEMPNTGGRSLVCALGSMGLEKKLANKEVENKAADVLGTQLTASRTMVLDTHFLDHLLKHEGNFRQTRSKPFNWHSNLDAMVKRFTGGERGIRS